MKVVSSLLNYNNFRRIEEFIDPKFDIEFYDRFFNQEIMVGSYIAKNSNWSINFLQSKRFTFNIKIWNIILN